MRYFFAIVFILFFTTALFVGAATLKNAGFIQGNIWYSEDPFYVGDTIRVYSAIFNNGGSDLIGTVEFYDNADKIGSSNFSAINGRLVEVWTDWTVTSGKHKIYAKIVGAKIAKVGGGYEAVELPSIFTGSNEKLAFIKPVAAPPAAAPAPAAPQASQTGGQAAGGAGDATSTIPARIAATAVSYAEKSVIAINSVADNLAAKVEAKKTEAKNNISVLSAQETEASNFQKPLQYMYLASLQALGFVLENKILLYAVLGFALFKLLRWCYNKIVWQS